MCDTMVALGNSTKDGSVIFAKNSDRQPNEPHIMIKVPHKVHKIGSKVRCTYIEIDQAEETYEVLLLKPSWIWGCEMGCNEFGLNIGNEAVFTKENHGKDSLIGMDMVRIALERCRTSEEALHMITGLLEKYGQGGNCGYQKHFTYHNSFLIADNNSAWVLETAGIYWAAEKVKDIRSISNCLTIGNKFDLGHRNLIQHAVSRGWCRSESDFSFAGCYGDPLITRLSGSMERYRTTSTILEREKGHITVDTMTDILRSHETRIDGKQFERSSLKSVCMHGGFIIGDHTTGSYIASLSRKACTYWVTGSSTPCISVFKPLWLVDSETMTFTEYQEAEAMEYWRKREQLHRLILENKLTSLSSYLHERDELENQFKVTVDAIDFSNTNSTSLADITNYAAQKEECFIDRIISESQMNPGNIKGGTYYKHYWNKQNKKLLKPRGLV